MCPITPVVVALANVGLKTGMTEDVRMGASDAAMEYDEDLIFKHLYAFKFEILRSDPKWFAGVSILIAPIMLGGMVWLLNRSTRKTLRNST